VADTVGGIVTTSPDATIAIVGAAVSAGLVWNLATWSRGLPSSSSHALVGGLVGAGVVDGGLHAVRWGGFDGLRPVGVAGVLVALALSPLLGAAAAWVASGAARRALRRARREVERPIRRAEWVTASALALSHGANDAQKTMGVVTLLLVADGRLDHFAVPLWVKLAAAASLTVGTTLGGWRIVRTIGRGIYRIRALDGLVSQGSSATVILASAAVGAPVSTTHVVASSVVGVGVGQRWRHVRWAVVREMLAAWLLTLPGSALLAALLLVPWRWMA